MAASAKDSFPTSLSQLHPHLVEEKGSAGIILPVEDGKVQNLSSPSLSQGCVTDVTRTVAHIKLRVR